MVVGFSAVAGIQAPLLNRPILDGRVNGQTQDGRPDTQEALPQESSPV